MGLTAFLSLMAGAVSALGCWALLRTQAWHGHLSHDQPEGRRKIHLHPTPRIAGVALMAALVVVWHQAPVTQAAILGPIMLSAWPAFLSGLADDLGLHKGAASRLAATLLSGVLLWWVAGLALNRTGFEVLDEVLRFLPLAVTLTALALAGMANAVNLIDGFNGQAGGVSLIIFVALSAVAWQAGDVELAALVVPLVALLAGFLLLNFPQGRIFLGDGGAYLIGFLIGAVALLLLHRNPGVSPWAVLLVAAYPVVEVLFSMVRRRARGKPLMQPDALHLHSLLQRRFSRRASEQGPAWESHARAAPVIWLLAALGAGWGVIAWNHTPSSVLGLGAFVGFYTALYRRVVSRRVVRRRAA